MQNKRYIKAEEATNGDSGVFAVAAASAEEPKDQAKLYKFLSGSILAVHGHNPALLEAWLHNQTEFSMNMFIGYDDFKDQGRTIPRTDKNERLLERNQDGGVDTTGTVDMWKTRITELEKAIKDDNLQPYHLRWIEFLAHSVDVPGLIKTARGRT